MAEARLQDLIERRPAAGRLERVAVVSLHTSPTASLGHSANGGLNVYVRETCAALAELGIATDVFTRRRSDADPEIEQLGPLTRIVNLPAGSPQLDKYSLFDEVEGFADRVAGWSQRSGTRYDVLHSHYWLSGAAACSLRGRLRLPWVHTAHTLGIVKNAHLAPGALPEPPLRLELEGEIARSADLLVVSTAAEGEDLVRAYRVRRDRIQVVAPGVDIERFRPAGRAQALEAIGRAGARLLLFVGRLERLKGVDVALRALALVDAPEVRLLVLGGDSRVGAESELERLRQLAAELGVAERVEFAGSVDQSDLPLYYAAAEACLMPSYSESFGLVGLEAQACGCPVIAANVDGLASVIRDQVTGFLVDGDDPAEYASRIRRLLDEPGLVALMGRRANLLAQRFSWSTTADRLASAYGELTRAQVRVQPSALQE